MGRVSKPWTPKMPTMPKMPKMPTMPKMPKMPTMKPKRPTTTPNPKPKTRKKPQVNNRKKQPNAAFEFCKENPNMCAAGVASVALSGYYGAKEWNELKEEEQDCLRICYPDDWKEFKSGQKVAPTFKEEDAVSPYDSSVRYAILYPDMAEQVCTKTNLAKKGYGSTDCKAFCESTCKFDMTDVIGGAAKSAANDAKNVVTGGIKGTLKSLLGENYKYWLIGIIVGLLLMVSLPILVRLIPS